MKLVPAISVITALAAACDRLTFRDLWRTVAVIGLVMCAACVLLWTVAALPTPLAQQVRQGVDSGMLTDNYPRYLEFRKLDMATECTGIGVALSMQPDVAELLAARHFGDCQGLTQAAEQNFNEPPWSYARYVHGYVVALKPLYAWLPVWGVRLVTTLVGISLLTALYLSVRRRVGPVHADVLLAAFACAGTLHVFFLVTHAAQLWLVLIGAMLALRCSTGTPLALFAGIGAGDALVSFLNMGSLSLGLALLCWCLVQWSNRIPPERILAEGFLACCAWSVGFVTPWLIKWLLVITLLPPGDLFGSTLTRYSERGLHVIRKALYNDFKATIWQVWLLGCVAIGVWRVRCAVSWQPGLWVLLFPALIPFVWICLIPVQSGVSHSTFVSIILWPLLAAVWMVLLAVPPQARWRQIRH